MIEKIIAALAGFIIAVISKAGYLGVMLLMAIESACIPLPSEIIMPFAGYLVYKGQFNLAAGGHGGRDWLQSWVQSLLMKLDTMVEDR